MSQINLVKMTKDDPRVINEKCKCQNENVIKCIENESEINLKNAKMSKEKFVG